MDCVKTVNSNGCTGGTPQDALQFWKNNDIALEKDYPYTGKAGKCRTTTDKHLAQSGRSYGWELLNRGFVGWTVMTSLRRVVHISLPPYNACPPASQFCPDQAKYELDMLIMLVEEGPFFVWVDPRNWSRYTAADKFGRPAVFDPQYCSSRGFDGSHIVQVVGISQIDGKAHWILKNSWGPGWGFNGYMYLPVGVNACGMMNYVGRAAVSAASERHDKLNDPEERAAQIKKDKQIEQAHIVEARKANYPAPSFSKRVINTIKGWFNTKK